MKKFCYSAFVAFWSSVATIVVLGLLVEQPTAAENSPTVYTLNELAAHNSEADCWMAIEDNIYDLTAYIAKHPTPPSVLVPYCGTEATSGMRTKGYGRDHSEYAWTALREYHVGQLAK